MEESKDTTSIKALITARVDTLTASDRRIANTVLADYPFAALVSIKELAEHTRVSAPSITRFVHKLGCRGYQDFQRALINELRFKGGSPLDLKRHGTALSEDGFLDDYTARISTNLEQLAGSVQSADLDAICALLNDHSRTIYLIGGRVSAMLAQYFAVHLERIRPRVVHLDADAETLPGDILRMRRQDVLMVIDFRRYQAVLERLAAAAASRTSCTMVLITDKWISPVGKYCTHVVLVPIETSTPWDSYASAFTLIEALIVRVSEANWDRSERRIAAWDDMRAALAPKNPEKDGDR